MELQNLHFRHYPSLRSCRSHVLRSSLYIYLLVVLAIIILGTTVIKSHSADRSVNSVSATDAPSRPIQPLSPPRVIKRPRGSGLVPRPHAGWRRPSLTCDRLTPSFGLRLHLTSLVSSDSSGVANSAIRRYKSCLPFV